jgi:hypothetical protein
MSTPHLLVLGDNETGKTNILRLVLRAIQQRYDSTGAKVVILNHPRDLHSGFLTLVDRPQADVSGRQLADFLGSAVCSRLIERPNVAIETDLKAGLKPCAIVASVGTTTTTAVDPLKPITLIGVQ